MLVQLKSTIVLHMLLNGEGEVVKMLQSSFLFFTGHSIVIVFLKIKLFLYFNSNDTV